MDAGALPRTTPLHLKVNEGAETRWFWGRGLGRLIWVIPMHPPMWRTCIGLIGIKYHPPVHTKAGTRVSAWQDQATYPPMPVRAKVQAMLGWAMP